MKQNLEWRVCFERRTGVVEAALFRLLELSRPAKSVDLYSKSNSGDSEHHMTPIPTCSLVLSKLPECFSDPDAAREALALLDAYGTKPWHCEQDRVHLAILKLSENDLQKLKAFVASAQLDFRDVLAAAEYPEEFQASGKTCPGEMAAVRDRDKAQYLQWLNGS